MKRFWDDLINGSPPMLYYIVMVGSSAALALALPMVIGFMARQFLFCRSRIAKAKRGKIDRTETESVSSTNPTNRRMLRSVRGKEENEVSCLLWSDDHRIFPDDSPFDGRQNLHSGLHPGGKEFFLLRSKNPICETAGWIALS